MYYVVINGNYFDVSGSEAAYAAYKTAAAFADMLGLYCALVVAETGEVIEDNMSN